ncbi:hypothetical protein LCGC14_1394120 [marine sediment metagenome]|uniref:DUF1616 domain-containing protein n=1 Tax=marine sediment metagenome TaxID=412755 RepID=A0A0F9JZ83_9ZZZZ
MNDLTKKKEGNSLKESYKQFGLLLKISLIIGILIVSGFIIYYVLNPEPGFVGLGILNSEKRAEEYPTDATVNETISFYVTVENQMKREFSFRIEILKGDNKTVVTSSGSFNATSFFNTTKATLMHNQFWISEMLNISFSQPGAKQRIIVELWEIKDEREVYYNNLFLWLNIIN